MPPECTEAVVERYIDEHLLIVEKPSGLLSVPGRYVKDSVLKRVREKQVCATIVHRLDLDTSGLMVLALSAAAATELNRQFRDREVKKEYIADVFGVVDNDRGTIDKPIAKDWRRRPRQVIDETGKAALTRYELVRRRTRSTRLRLMPITGRSHQLRIHLASIDHPIIGCDLYAHEEALLMGQRLHLHASELAFRHPQSRQMIRFESIVPFNEPH